MTKIIIRSFAPEDYPAIIHIHNSLNIAWPERPSTVAGWTKSDRSSDPRCQFQRWVAVEAGNVIGFGDYTQSSFDYHPQKFSINVEVSLDHQTLGVGAALYEQILAGLRPFQPRILRADAFANIPQGLSFLQKHGFYETSRDTPVHLPVASFDPAPYADLEARLAAKGIVIKTLLELASDHQRDQKVYDLYWEAVEDMPQEETAIERLGFDEWGKWVLNNSAILHEAYFIAVHGNEYVGLRELAKEPGNAGLTAGLLGTKREYRGQGIGLALQLCGIAYAKREGYQDLRTCTDVRNLSMQAIYEKLGYLRDPDWIHFQKDIPQPSG